MKNINRVGMLGLGTMGGPIALNLLKKGNEPIVAFDPVPDICSKYAEEGIEIAKSYEEFAECDLIFLSLPNSKVVEKVLFGDDGLVGYLKAGQIVVDLSTIQYSTTLVIESKFKEKGISFLDAPVSGMGARAVEGTLSVMCGGEKEVFDNVEPFLNRMGNKVIYMGKVGSGQLTKLINQLLFDINVAAIAEILPFSQKMGLDPKKVADIVNSGTGRSFASEFFIPKILENNFSGGYPLESAYKDLVSASEISSTMNLPLPVLSAATTTYQMALLKGYGKEDKGGMIHVFEELFGVEFRVGEK